MRLTYSKRPYYHVHIDGKRTRSPDFESFAKRLGFYEMPFSCEGDNPPIVHLTKKYSENRLAKMQEDLALLKSQAAPLNYIGYIECEKIRMRAEFVNPNPELADEEINPPFGVINRELRVAAGEYFKTADIHLTIPTTTPIPILEALTGTGLLRVRPQYTDSWIYTVQFVEKGIDLIILGIARELIDFVQVHGRFIPHCVIKVEEIVDFHVSSVDGPDLPRVVSVFQDR